MISDELSDANEALLQERSRNRAAATTAGEGEQAAAAGVRGMAERVEAIATRLETP